MNKGDKKHKWSVEQIEEVRKRFETEGPDKLVAALGIPRSSIKHMAHKLGLRYPTTVWNIKSEQLLRDRYQKDGPSKLAKQLGIGMYAVIGKAQRLGIGPTRNRPRKIVWTEAMLTAIRTRYQKESGYKLAEEFGLTREDIQEKASELGVRTIVGHAIAGRKRAESATHCNIRYFDTWSPNMAYILGFLFADGCVAKDLYSVSANLVTDDESILQFIKEELKAKADIRHSPVVSDEHYQYCRPSSSILLSSKVLVSKLVELGLKPRKTYNDDPFPNVPADILPHFVRGYFDGDGCASEGAGFVGSPCFIEGLRDVLHRYIGMSCKRISTIQGKTTIYAAVNWGKIDDVRKFRAYVYPDESCFCLARKKAKLDDWLAKHRFPRGHYFGNGRSSGANWTPWTQQELDMVRELYQQVGQKELAKRLNRGVDAIKNKARQLGVVGKSVQGINNPPLR